MKNKKVLIISIVFFIILISIILVTIYFTTDLFKGNKKIFFENLGKIEIVDFNFFNAYKTSNKKITNNSNLSTSNIDIYKSDINKETGVADVQKILNIKSNGLNNVDLKQSYKDFTISANDPKSLILKFVKDNNVYGIGIDNVLAKYITVENTNLKELFNKIGTENITQTPNTIPNNVQEILNINEDTIKTLIDSYVLILRDNINEGNFYKIYNEDKTQIIGVTLTQQETVDLLKIILEKAKDDNTFLDFALNKAQLLGYNQITNESLKAEIQKYIDELNNQTYSSDKGFLKIELLKKNKEITNIKISGKYKENNKLDLITPIENNYEISISVIEKGKIGVNVKENEKKEINLIFTYAYDENDIKIGIDYKTKNEDNKDNIINIQYQISNYQTDNITQNMTVSLVAQEENNFQINLSKEINIKQDVQIEKLTTENSVKINGMSSEELSELFTAIKNRFVSLYADEINYIYNTIENSDKSRDADEISTQQEKTVQKNTLNNE